MKPKTVAVLDIEAQNLVDDWEKPWEAGIASTAVWINWSGGPFGKHYLFAADELDHLEDVLKGAEILVTFNGKRYDLKALNGCYGRPIYKGHHCDLMLLLQEKLGHRIGLEKTSRATLGRGKSGHGDAAPKMYQRGAFAKLHTYNMDDVDLTRDLFLYARKHGFLWVPSGEGRKAVPVDVLPGVNRQAVKQYRDFKNKGLLKSW